MNKGKICVSVCAETADELFQQVKRAEEFADVIEVRFDCLKTNEITTAIKNLQFSKTLLATFRSKEQGGKHDFTLRERLKFWESFLYHNQGKDYYVDFENDIPFFTKLIGKPIIASIHFWEETPKDLESVFTNLSLLFENVIIKLAVQTKDITDTIPIWQLLKKAKSEDKEIIPIAMGESGKWTRILGLAYGAFMTYASLDAEKATAPGQVTAKDLHEIYRAKELNVETEVYGILGSNTSVSMSPYIHNTAFKFHELNSVFLPLQVHNLDEFITRMVKLETREIDVNFKGFAVTIPHKQSIIKHLDYLDETAEKIGAVNTVKIIDGKFHGFNTDAHGFIEPLKNIYGDLNEAKVALLGAGGSARACLYALQKNGAEVTIFARDVEKSKALSDEFGVEIKEFPTSSDKIGSIYDIIINSTPLGMRGKAEGQTPLTSDQLKGAKLAYDLVYIPSETQFLKEAKLANIPTIGGLEMLLSQAVEQQRIWTNLQTPLDEIRKIVLSKL